MGEAHGSGSTLGQNELILFTDDALNRLTKETTNNTEIWNS